MSSMSFKRAWLLIPPPERHKLPKRLAPSNAAQNPMNGPNENGNANRSSGVSSIRRKISAQQCINQSQLAGVSNQAHGLASCGAGGLVQSRIPGERVRQILAIRRVRGLILHKLRLGGEGELLKIAHCVDGVDIHARLLKLRRPKRIFGDDLAQQILQPSKLESFQFLTGKLVGRQFGHGEGFIRKRKPQRHGVHGGTPERTIGSFCSVLSP